MAPCGLLGKKIGMTQVFNQDGTRTGVTAVELGPCYVVQKRTAERDGYTAVQLGYEDKPEHKAKRPEFGHFNKVGVSPKRYLREFRISPEVAEQLEPGSEMGAAALAVGERVHISGLSRGLGFAGVMKRWGFRGAKATHGVHEAFRHGGSLGQCKSPGRVMRGKKMASHQGDHRVTLQNVEVVRVFPEDNIVFLKGPIPGARNSLLEVSPAGERDR
jgi:large subunit ribosomal protein L3